MSHIAAPPLGVYVHWPYCARICPYCDFNVVRDRGRLAEQAELVDAMIADLHGYAALSGPRALASIFFGGGTPSLMDPGAVARLVGTARSLWETGPDLEVTLEANPTDAEVGRFAALAAAGINRLSLGLQSLDDDALRFLGRNHDAATGQRAAVHAGRIFQRVSIDLIYALPGQTTEAWTTALTQTVALGSEHISPYQLTIEPGTAFDRARLRGALIPPVPDLAADLYETTQAVLEDAGFEAYEVSNHARGLAARSRHNLIYWRGEDYIGVGPGAHGRLTLADGRHASTTPGAVRAYVDQVRRRGHGAVLERLSSHETAVERLLMGLRTDEGVALSELSALEIPCDRLDGLGDRIAVRDARLYATKQGRPVLDRLVAILADSA